MIKLVKLSKIRQIGKLTEYEIFSQDFQSKNAVFFGPFK